MFVREGGGNTGFPGDEKPFPLGYHFLDDRDAPRLSKPEGSYLYAAPERPLLSRVPDARRSGAPAEHHVWTARVRWSGENRASAYARRHAFAVGRSASFDSEDPDVSAVEYLLGALGGDLVTGFARAAARRGVILDGLEAATTGRLSNPLIALGVVGETDGHPGLEEITVTLYVSAADADDSQLETIWQATLAASPLFHTLRRAVDKMRLEMQIIL